MFVDQVPFGCVTVVSLDTAQLNILKPNYRRRSHGGILSVPAVKKMALRNSKRVHYRIGTRLSHDICQRGRGIR